ncbi:S24 family peptidase [Oceanithermus sp.]|uniref:S24 family peptidase n=1 Tax=Oceanithermus sp. TaxID=2268145 RepID=UPI00257B5A9B|nr:S24 family peptidase [Oceanithermus sp.]
MEYTVPIREDVMRPGAVAFEVHGDSMDDGSAEAIRNGDLVLVDTSLTDLVPGKVYLVELPGQGLMVKRLRRVGDALWFMSDNPINGSFPAEDAVRVVGQVYGRISFGRVN